MAESPDVVIGMWLRWITGEMSGLPHVLEAMFPDLLRAATVRGH